MNRELEAEVRSRVPSGGEGMRDALSEEVTSELGTEGGGSIYSCVRCGAIPALGAECEQLEKFGVEDEDKPGAKRSGDILTQLKLCASSLIRLGSETGVDTRYHGG